MLTNSSLTVYHKVKDNHSFKWVRFNYANVWWYGGRGTSLNKGYDGANDVQIRIFYELNEGLKYENFQIGDILVQGTLSDDITSESDVKVERYNITSLTNNIFGGSKHIHISGK